MLYVIVGEIVLARVEDSATFFSYLSGMYGWILDGISSLFEPVTGKNATEWAGNVNVSEEEPTRPGLKAGAQRQENHSRPAKRNYQRSVVKVNASYLCSLCRYSLKT